MSAPQVPQNHRTLHRNQRRALPLNTNNIALHEEAIKAFEENEESCTTHSRQLEQHRHRAKAKANQNIAANNWTIEKRRLDALEATATKQLNDVLQRLDLSPSQLLDADVHTDHHHQPSTQILGQVDSILQHQHQPDQNKVSLTPAMVASCLIQARDEFEAIGEDLEKACKIASAQARKAQLKVTQALRADLDNAEFPPQLKAKLDVLKKASVGNDDNNNDDDTGSESAFIALEATIIERLAKVQAKYDDQISSGRNLDEATIAFRREIQQASRWAIRQVDDAIARESNRREVATLASIRKELKEECSHRLAELREARQKAALIAMNEEQERRLVQKTKEEEHAAQRERERTETNAALEQWRETERQEEERQRVEDSARKYQEELDRIERIKANVERVSYRETRLRNKMDEKRKALTEAARAEELKYERLSQLAATVPYWDNILDACANIHGTTVARENGAYHEDVTGLTAFQHGLSKLQSFTNEKVFSERRFRLGHALHEAGISQTAAARDAVARAAPRERNPICDHST